MTRTRQNTQKKKKGIETKNRQFIEKPLQYVKINTFKFQIRCHNLEE